MKSTIAFDPVLPVNPVFGSSSSLRVYKMKLTRTATVLADLASPNEGLGQLLEASEHSLLKQSIEIIQNVSQKIETAKERKLRDEKALEQAFHDRQAQGWAAAKRFFPIEHQTLEQQIRGLCTAMALNQLALLHPSKKPELFKAHILDLGERLSANFGAEYFFHELFNDCQQCIQEFITASDSTAVDASMTELAQLLEQTVPALQANETVLIQTLTRDRAQPLISRGIC